jgi:hypothetical protein
MLVAGAIGAGVTTSVTSGLNASGVLATARDREYAAEGAIDDAVVHVRQTNPASSIGLTSCGPFLYTLPLQGSKKIDIRVDCSPAPEVTADLSARNNVIFVACIDDHSNDACDATVGSAIPAPAIIRTQINYQVSGTGPASQVTRTYAQAWSVNG